jgi:cytochrome c oxidase assembly protein subunit 15
MASHFPISAGMAPRATSRAGSAPVEASPALKRYGWCVVAYNILVILWGNVVSATGSGNGCGDHWPLCGGTVVQHWKTTASIIEFSHRATSGIDVLAMVALVGWVWNAMPRRHLARLASAAAMALTLTEGLLGALLVLLHHTGTDQSPMRAFWFSLHLTNTLLMLAALALTAHFLGRITGRMRGGVEVRYSLVAVVGLLATLIVGVSGSLAALGDTLYPSRSLAEAFAQDFSPHANWLLHIRWIHPTLSLFAGAWILFLVAKSRSAGNRQLGSFVAAMVGVQIALGIADVLLLAPTWLQVTHLLGADLLWISLVVLSARLCIRPLGCMGEGCTAKAVQRAARPAPVSVATGA